MQAKTQLIAHDKEVYDLAFAAGVHVFASVGADGSVRMFDLRSLEHSTIIYESADGQGGSPVPLIRLAWNKQDPNYLATITSDSSTVVILDIRVPSLPAAKLEGHSQCVNAVSWAPHSSSHICTAGDDNQARAHFSRRPETSRARARGRAASADPRIRLRRSSGT